ncbi:helix-turn-helix domain-containing protein [Shewanella sp. KX20019]|uniref:helix-turn-helix domain-containing protein n=1 Tax=Shewanella sp. KX20019 TaxID=2803864 RepID=UPI001925D583|nr:helix-turn-helix domain-containing protein [Shewanella sp. KX20019]QQX80832.1 helix-turn-helix domain-containing protein [Shewanella sp. KX20019]
MPKNELLTEEDVANITKLSRRFFVKRRMPNHPEFGELPFVKLGRSIRYPAADFYKWLDSNKHK